MKLKIENLNWNNANVFEFKYIYYLALMTYERSFKVGINVLPGWKLSDYEPCGLFRFKQLHDIYRIVIQLGKYYYFNPNNLNDRYFKNGKNVKYFGYTVKELSEIADFDFYSYPLLPGQRLDYYNKFLKPLYLCLKEFKKIWVNAFIGSDETKMYYGENRSYGGRHPIKEVNHITQQLTGQDYLDYYSFEGAKSREAEFCCNNSRPGYTKTLNGHSTFLGGVVNGWYRYFYSFGYYKTKWNGISWVTNGHELDYAQNFQGIQFSYYSTIPSATIQCPIPLQKNCPYNLYMYSFTYDLSTVNTYLNQFYSVSGEPNYRDFWEPENAPGEEGYRDLKTLPAIIKLPFGNYFQTDSGIISANFNTFNISLPTKYPFDQTAFNDIPAEYICNNGTYQQVDYTNSYDTNIWQATGATPEYSDDDDHRPLDPGVYLGYIPDQPYTSYKRCRIQCWYKPLLVVSYEGLFNYN